MPENFFLTEKQARFVDEYLIDLNATAAAVRAGYSQQSAGKIGPRLVGESRISVAIQERMKERRERTGLNQDYVLNNLTEVVERCMQRRPVMSGGKQVQDDEGRSVWTFDARGAVRALELVGKHLGMFKERIEASVEAVTPASILEAARRNREHVEALEREAKERREKQAQTVEG